MGDDAYAYLMWCCSECGDEPIEEREGTHDLRCETCGHLFLIRDQFHADLVPDPDLDA